MSTTKAQQKTISEATEETEPTRFELRTLVAQTTKNTDEIPDWQQFNAACTFTLETVRRLAENN